MKLELLYKQKKKKEGKGHPEIMPTNTESMRRIKGNLGFFLINKNDEKKINPSSETVPIKDRFLINLKCKKIEMPFFVNKNNHHQRYRKQGRIHTRKLF